jgi:hypothetical protein
MNADFADKTKHSVERTITTRVSIYLASKDFFCLFLSAFIRFYLRPTAFFRFNCFDLVKRPMFFCSLDPVFGQFRRSCAQTTAKVQRQSHQ